MFYIGERRTIRVMEGLTVETRNSYAKDGTVELEYTIYIAEEASKNEPIIRRFQGTARVPKDQLVFLHRMDTGEKSALILTVRATHRNISFRGKSEPKPSAQIRATLYQLDSLRTRNEILKLATEDPARAQAELASQGEAIESICSATIPGHSLRVGHFIPRTEANVYHKDGTQLELEVCLDHKQRIDLAGELRYLRKNRKRAKNTRGERIDQREQIGRMLSSGETHFFPSQVELIPADGAVREAAPFIVAVTATAHGEGFPEPAPANGAADGAFTTKTYRIPANLMRVLREKNPKLPSDIPGKLLRAAGLPFPDEANAVYKATQSSLVLKHNNEGHKRFVELISDIEALR